MAMGMSCDEYWNGDPALAKYYREAYNLERQRKSEEMWLQGLYIYDAVSVALKNALSKKGTRPQKYMEEPLRITPLTPEEKEIKAEKERQKTIEYFNKMAKKWNARKGVEDGRNN